MNVYFYSEINKNILSWLNSNQNAKKKTSIATTIIIENVCNITAAKFKHISNKSNGSQTKSLFSHFQKEKTILSNQRHTMNSYKVERYHNNKSY